MKNAVVAGQVGLVKVGARVCPVKFITGGLTNIKGQNLITNRTVTIKTVARVRSLIFRGK